MSSFWHSRRRREADLEAEIRTHLDMATQDHLDRGEGADTAERAARREFGDVVGVRETTSDMWSGESLHQVAQDVRHAVRSLARAPGFTIVALLTLALGIGANTAIFSVLNGVLLRPLPYPHPDQLVFITSQFPTLGFNQFPMDPAEFLELQSRNQSFQSVGAYVASAVNIGADATPERVPAIVASSSLFTALGVTPMRGRSFTDAETLPNAAPVVVLSSELWRSAFGARDLIGKQIDVDGTQRTVVGIMPDGFDVHDQGARIWLPLTLDPALRKPYRGSHYLLLVGRLKNGATMAGARSELETMLKGWAVADGGTAGAAFNSPGFVHVPDTKNHRLRYDALQDDVVGSIGRALWILQIAVAFVLLIACANLANLLLMRAESRHKELALRAALGAGRWRLMRQFIVESLVLSVAGAALGIGLGQIGLKALLSAGASSIPRAADVGIDAHVLVFTLLLALGTGVLFGLAPILHLSVNSVGLALREAGSRTTSVAARNRVRRGLVVSEVALAMMLVIGAGLLMRSFWNLIGVDAGFDRTNLTTFSIALPQRVYADSSRRVAFFDRVTQQLASAPGVTAAAAMTGLPPQRQVNANDTMFEGFVPTPNGPAQNVDYYQYATPSYFTTMRIPIVRGRSFGASDGPLTQPVALINETTARLFYPQQDPIGRRIKPGGSDNWFTIIGVAKDVKQGGVDSKTGTELYLDYEQAPAALGYAPANLNVVVRSTLDRGALVSVIRRVVRDADASLPIVKLRSMDEVFKDSVSRQRFLTTLLGVFASVALLLSAIGTYGVLAYSVTERRREVGIRMALGASERGVLMMVLRQGMALAVGGIIVGLVGAAAVTRLAAALLFGVKPVDPVTFGGVAVFMLAVAAAASLIPARRATRVDPLVALRAD
ncbi:MAG TPA: ABC transporter permease [Gemmatimonadaceae bacterium]|jgi:putative ABC transport system permease protein